VVGERHASAALFPGKDQLTTVYERGWPAGPVWRGAENLALTGIRSLDRSNNNDHDNYNNNNNNNKQPTSRNAVKIENMTKQ